MKVVVAFETKESKMKTKTIEGLNRRQLERLRMLADWQLREEGYNPSEVTAACLALDVKEGR